MKRFILIGIVIMSILVSGGAVTNATCLPTPTSGNDKILCTGTTLSGINGGDGDDIITNNGFYDTTAGSDSIEGGDGNDIIINNGTVIDAWIVGGNGNDIIINNGTAENWMRGGNGNDIIINNGTAENWMRGEDGDDTLINNGTVENNMRGEDGNDTLINNGIAENHMRGEDGNDTLINNGSVEGNIEGGNGNDYVLVRGSVGGIIDGGSGYDILEFQANVCIGAEGSGDIVEEFLTISGLNPASDSVTYGGNTYTWIQFEELIADELWMSFCDGRNEAFDTATPLVSYCNIYGGLDIYDVNEIGVNGRITEGVLVIRTDRADTLAALELAISSGQNQLIAEDVWGNQLWALSSNELQIMGPEVWEPGKIYVSILSPAVCGIN